MCKGMNYQPRCLLNGLMCVDQFLPVAALMGEWMAWAGPPSTTNVLYALRTADGKIRNSTGRTGKFHTSVMCKFNSCQTGGVRFFCVRLIEVHRSKRIDTWHLNLAREHVPNTFR